MVPGYLHYSGIIIEYYYNFKHVFGFQVKLMNQIKTETVKSREAEKRRQREIGQLKKEQRAKDNQIRGLKTEKHHRDLVLKRKQEEVRKSVQVCNQLQEEKTTLYLEYCLHSVDVDNCSA